jgi:hypothetical protein
MTRAIYLVGAPGTGKSTVMDWILQDWNVGEKKMMSEPNRKGALYGHRLTSRAYRQPDLTGVYLGVRRPQFPGTDALSMSVNPVAVGWLEAGGADALDLVVGEGARLGNRPFLGALRARCTLTLIHLTGDPDVLYQRGLDRPDDGDWKPVSVKRPDGTWGVRKREAGQPQSPRYLASRLGACRAIAAEFPSVTLDTTQMTQHEVEDTLCTIL